MSGVKRTYDATRRQAQARATRQDVLDAAGRLFATKGYAAATIDEIADEAQVSRETIFKAFGAKRQLLRLWVEREAAGPDEPVSIRDQQWMRRIRDTPERQAQLAVAAAAARAIHERTIAGIEVMRAAAHADPEIAALWDEARRRRREDVSTLTRLLTADGPARLGSNGRGLVDVVYTLTSPEVYDLLVRQCGWRPERYEAWLVEALDALAVSPAQGS
jgi:AcrR family transcriptional regulator